MGKVKNKVRPVEVRQSYANVEIKDTYHRVEIIPLPKTIADVYIYGVCPIGSGFRYVELIDISGGYAKISQLTRTCRIRLNNLRIKKLCGGQKLCVVDDDIFVVYPNKEYVKIGTTVKRVPLHYDIGEDYDELVSIVSVKLRKMVMKLKAMKSFEDMVAICPVATIVGKPRSDRFYVVAFNGDDGAVAYTTDGNLKFISPKDGQLQIINSSKLRVERTGTKLTVKNLVTNRTRVLGFEDSEDNDGSVNIEQLMQNLPKTLQKGTVIDTCDEKRSVKSMTTENTAAAATTTSAPATKKAKKPQAQTVSLEVPQNAAPITPTAAPSAAPTAVPAADTATAAAVTEAAATKATKKSTIKIPNPPGPDGKPRKGRPPRGWRKQKLDEMLAAKTITQEQYDEAIKEA